MSNQDDSLNLFGEVIYAYTRAQAIADGVLVDVTPTAREAGFRWPVALTRAAWEDCVAWSEEDSRRQVHQDESGRLWDVLWMAMNAIRRSSSGASQTLFRFYRVPRDGKCQGALLVTLKLVAGPGDASEPVITIMQPQED
jgi:Family of unknown function (DUF6573)